MSAMPHLETPASHGIGPLLQYWRKSRRLSQLDLAVEADVSARHVSFLETGRAKPSREMVLLLADALQVPLRERNALLGAAGFAPLYRESSLDDPLLAPVRSALDAILTHQEPYPAVVMNPRWDIVTVNDAARTFFARVLAGRTPPDAGNVLRLFFHPEGVRPAVTNWESVARSLLDRLQREAVGGVLDDAGRALLAEILSYPGVPKEWRTPELGTPLLPVLPVSFRLDGEDLRYFSAITVLGTPQDVTLQELRIECFFPADAATAAAAHRPTR